jgi:hypothetical protein
MSEEMGEVSPIFAIRPRLPAIAVHRLPEESHRTAFVSCWAVSSIPRKTKCMMPIDFIRRLRFSSNP